MERREHDHHASGHPPQKSADDVRAALESAGCRFTSQRAAVYAYLEEVDNHPTAEQVYRAVRRRVPKISLATVYKALEALVHARLATKLNHGDGSARYDCRGDDHYHLRDVTTDEVRDLPARFDPQLLEKLDPSLVEAARTLGASPVLAFFNLVVPVLRNTLLATLIMVFVFALGSYLLPQLLGRPQHWTLSVLITDQAIYQSNLPFAAAMAIFLVFVSLGLVGLSIAIGRRGATA
jgi:Fe2+ or Zn2+ uptake regulation protein